MEKNNSETNNLRTTSHNTNNSQQPVVKLSPQQKSDKKWLIFGLVSLVIFILGTTTYLIYQNIQLKKIIVNSQPTLPTPTIYQSPTPALAPTIYQNPTPTIDPMGNWETYSNTTHKITFKYPLLWNLTENQGHESQGVTYNTQVVLEKSPAKITMYFNMDGIGGMPQNYEGEPFTLDKNSLYQYHKINSYNNTKLIGIANSQNTLGVFMLDGITYSITLEYPAELDKAEESELIKDFNQILSTFRFIK